MRFKVSARDLARNIVIEPGWYHVVVTSVEDKIKEEDGSAQIIIGFTMKGGKYPDLPVSRLFTEKAPGFITNFVYGLTGKKMEEPGDVEITPSIVGREMLINVSQTNPKYPNSVVDFMPLNG